MPAFVEFVYFFLTVQIQPDNYRDAVLQVLAEGCVSQEDSAIASRYSRNATTIPTPVDREAEFLFVVR